MTNEQKEAFFHRVEAMEGFRSRPYRCPAGVLSIGYGHTSDVTMSSCISISEARKLLRSDFGIILSQLGSCDFILQEHELYAVADFVYNLGFTAFKRSSLFTLLTAYSSALDKKSFTLAERVKKEILNSFMLFRYYHDKNGVAHESLGLRLRREFEQKFFDSGLI